jgi:DNA-binding transcriptional LysR family regulator
MRRLPSLNGLRAFEAAARHGGFVGAADELNVTQAAVSRMVRLLEERLELQLFERRPNGLALTPQGKMLQPGLTAAFDAIADHMAKVIAMKSTPVLTLGVGPSFAMRWLIPRLASFYAKHPDIEVRLATGGAINPFNDEWTCGILLGNGDWEGYTAEPLFSAELIPVCAPAIAKRLKDPSQLAKESLLQVGHASEDWALWLDGAVLSLPPAAHAITFDNYGMAVQAAIDGLGVTNALRSYVEDDIRSGKLVAPFPLAVPKGQAWYIVYRTYRESDAGLIAFRAWMQEQSRTKKVARQTPRGDQSF